MNYPVWEPFMLGGGLVIGIIAILHVFVSHFAVGGGLFLVLTERKAYRENNPALLDYVKSHSKFFVLVVLVFGAVSGVAVASGFTRLMLHQTPTPLFTITGGTGLTLRRTCGWDGFILRPPGPASW